jgi:hypothetical protein
MKLDLWLSKEEYPQPRFPQFPTGGVQALEGLAGAIAQTGGAASTQLGQAARFMQEKEARNRELDLVNQAETAASDYYKRVSEFQTDLRSNPWTSVPDYRKARDEGIAKIEADIQAQYKPEVLVHAKKSMGTTLRAFINQEEEHSQARWLDDTREKQAANQESMLERIAANAYDSETLEDSTEQILIGIRALGSRDTTFDVAKAERLAHIDIAKTLAMVWYRDDPEGTKEELLDPKNKTFAAIPYPDRVELVNTLEARERQEWQFEKTKEAYEQSQAKAALAERKNQIENTYFTRILAGDLTPDDVREQTLFTPEERDAWVRRIKETIEIGEIKENDPTEYDEINTAIRTGQTDTPEGARPWKDRIIKSPLLKTETKTSLLAEIERGRDAKNDSWIKNAETEITAIINPNKGTILPQSPARSEREMMAIQNLKVLLESARTAGKPIEGEEIVKLARKTIIPTYRLSLSEEADEYMRSTGKERPTTAPTDIEAAANAFANPRDNVDKLMKDKLTGAILRSDGSTFHQVKREEPEVITNTGRYRTWEGPTPITPPKRETPTRPQTKVAPGPTETIPPKKTQGATIDQPLMDILSKPYSPQ